MMDDVKIDDKETIVMNLVHYFITERQYNPVVVHGINDEIWLENMNSDYKIIRIVSRYIHNDEQLSFNRFRSKQITKKLRLKTLSFKMRVLSIYVDLGENVQKLDEDDNGNFSLFVKNILDIKNDALLEVFPDIIEKTKHSEKGVELLFKITDDINNTNEKKNKRMEKIFSSKKPIATYFLIGLCSILFVLSGFGYKTFNLINFGANYAPLVKSGEVYRLITCMFLHGGLIHFGLNMYCLYVIGPRVEDFFGKKKFLLIYFLSGLCASLLSIVMNNNVVSVGASGAIFGLFGALIYFGYTYRGYIGAIVRSQIVPIVIFNLFISVFVSNIDMWGHVGGLIGGLILAKMTGTIESKKYDANGIMLFLIYIAFLIYMVFFR